jgi:predicted ATPase
VELASLADPALVAEAIGRVFHLTEQGGRPMMELLQEHLAEQQLLLILDNCEHLVDVCAEIAEQLVLHCWQLRILATSREPLRVPGERTTPILPLTLPGPDDLQAAQILSTPAAQLFVARTDAAGGVRAGATAPIDQIDSTDAAAIAQICRQLDGIPLALELAAPLSHNATLSEIAAQLQNQMEVLTNSYRTAVPRHQTMHSALVWSYRLLAPEEQRLLASVSVFAGGWTIEAAQAISVEGDIEPRLSALDQLVATSLVLREEHGGRRRYRLLEPVRQFAQAQLVASGAEDAVRRRHAAYFLRLAEQMYHARDTSNEGEWLDRLEPERDNLRAVSGWAIEHGEAELAHRFNGWLFAFWIYRSSKAEARRWADAALALTAPTPSPEALTAEALALDTAGYLAGFQRELEIYAQIGHHAADSLKGIAVMVCDLLFSRSSALSACRPCTIAYRPANTGLPIPARHAAALLAVRRSRNVPISMRGHAPRVITAWPVPSAWYTSLWRSVAAAVSAQFGGVIGSYSPARSSAGTSLTTGAVTLGLGAVTSQARQRSSLAGVNSCTPR